MGSARQSETPPSADSPARSDDLSFEVALERLESIVDRLEQGDLELESALAAFEEGVALARGCAERLETAERRLEVLVREGERWLTRAFEESEED
jgi:exodeoxyribonuclease VII small subunit